jgi:DNA-binding GntR family transcriptional regulator
MAIGIQSVNVASSQEACPRRAAKGVQVSEAARTSDAPRGADRVTSRRIAGALSEAILAGDFPPGTWLRQDDIAARFGTSRLPVREALRILEAEGLTALSPNRGARIPLLDSHEVNTYYRMRERLEPLTLVESLPNLREEQIARLEGLQAEIEVNTVAGRFLALDREFHLACYAGTTSEQLLSATVRLWNTTQHYRRALMLQAGPDHSTIVNAEHRLLLDAIRRRDPEDAERYLEGHIRRTRVELADHPEIFEAG